MNNKFGVIVACPKKIIVTWVAPENYPLNDSVSGFGLFV